MCIKSRSEIKVSFIRQINNNNNKTPAYQLHRSSVQGGKQIRHSEIFKEATTAYVAILSAAFT